MEQACCLILYIVPRSRVLKRVLVPYLLLILFCLVFGTLDDVPSRIISLICDFTNPKV